MKVCLTKTVVILLYSLLGQWSCKAFSLYNAIRVVPISHQSRHTLLSTPNKGVNEIPSSTSDSIISKLKVKGQDLLQRSDTLRTAGFYKDMECANPSHIHSRYPLLSGVKTGLIIFAIAIGMKFYRSIFVNKLSVFERQPAWGSVITSKEDEEKSNLEAMTCNNCGSTLFIAKGRKWFQFPKDYECYACGAKGIENFTNTRQEIKESFDDDDFEYQNPLDLLSSSEKRKWMKLAGGDEVKAAQLLVEKTTGDNKSKAKSGDVIVDETVTKKNKKVDSTSNSAGNLKGPSSSKPEDGLDLLGMDD